MIRARSCFGVALLLSASLLTVTQGTARASPANDLTGAVTRKLLDRAALSAETYLRTSSAKDTRVSVTRRSGQDWATGTAVVIAPHRADAYPQGWIFVAHAQAGGWQIAFDGEPGFADLAGAAPSGVVSGSEKQVFDAPSAPSAQYVGQDYRTGMRLPYGLGQSWRMRGGPHGWNGDDEPRSSVDLTGGDERVLAARDGIAYTMCKGWIRIFHSGGYATDYYHLWNNVDVDGASIAGGTYLGDTGTDVTCGGYADGRHVHFALRQNDEYVPIEGHNIGGWVFREGDQAYGGYALHGSKRVDVGGNLYNYGALGQDQGIVDANGGKAVDRWSGPEPAHRTVGTVADGTTVTISCSADGSAATGRWGTTSSWDRLSDGTWISDAYVWTGVDRPVAGSC